MAVTADSRAFSAAGQATRLDAIDGRYDGWLSNLTAGLITDTRQYNYSTQYLGYWLMQAEQACADSTRVWRKPASNVQERMFRLP